MEYEYVIVNESNSNAYQVERNLRAGYTISHKTAAGNSVHYVLERKQAVPEEVVAAAVNTADNTAVTPIEDLDDKPINLSDIPF